MYVTKILNGVHYEQNYVSSHMKTSTFTCIIRSHHEFHTSCFSLKLGNSSRRKIVISKYTVLNRHNDKSWTKNFVKSKGFLEQKFLHCALAKDFKICTVQFSPRKSTEVPEKLRQLQEHMTVTELHKVEVSFFVVVFLIILLSLWLWPNSQYLQTLKEVNQVLNLCLLYKKSKTSTYFSSYS